MTFPYTLHNNNSFAVIRPEIPLESRTSGELKSLAEHLLAQGVLRIIFDAEKTDYVSSEGLHTLFTVQRKIKTSGGEMIVARPSREVRSLFQVLQLSEFIHITDTLEEAMKIASNGSDVSSPSAGHQHSAEAAEGGKVFENPIVAECESCGAFVRIPASGPYMCPACKKEFTVSDDGTVVF